MIPDGWTVKRLDSVATLQRGFDLPKAQRLKGKVPVVSSSGISGYHNEAKVQAPGVVTGRYGSIGEVYFILEDYWPLNTALWVKDFHGNDEKFIYYLLSRFDFHKFSDKTGVPGVNRNELHTVKVNVPPLYEQQKIARIFSTWDKAINTIKQLLANNQQQKKALMQYLLNAKEMYLNVGEWRLTSLSEVCSGQLQTGPFGSQLHASEYVETGVPVLMPKDLINYQANTETAAKILPGRAEDLKKHKLLNGDLLFSRRGDVARFALIDKQTRGALCGTGCLKATPSIDHSSKFLAYLLQKKPVRHWLEQNAVGQTMPNMNTKILSELPLILPLLKEQQKIAVILSTADQKIETLQQKLTHLKQEKKALMQQLLTGKRRVKLDPPEKTVPIC